MRVLRVITAVILFHTVPAIAAEVDSLRVWTDPEKTRAVFDLDGRTSYQLFTLQNPNRVVIDLDGARVSRSFQLNPEHAGVISEVRTGSPEDGILEREPAHKMCSSLPQAARTVRGRST